MSNLLRDLRFAWSLLLRRPGATAVAVVSLALGIGANVALFSLMSAMLYRPLPVAHPDSLVRIFTTDRAGRQLDHSSYQDYLELRDRDTAFEGVAAYFYFPMGFSVNGSPEVVLGQLVTGNYFAVMGVRPALGRAFRPEEDHLPVGEAVTVLSHRLWERRFGSDPNIVGAKVLINSHPFTVVGVAPRGFTAPNVVMAPDVWVPVTTVRWTLPYPISLTGRSDSWLLVAARLKSGQGLAAAQAATDSVAETLAREFPDSNRDRRYRLVEADRARISLKSTTDDSERLSVILLAVVGLVLLVACLNVANLNLAGAIDRQREIALRHALGASRTRLLRQLLTESGLVAAIASACGLLVAVWTIDGLLAMQSTIVEFPIEIDARIDWRTGAFAAALALGSVVVFGLAPAWPLLRRTRYAGLKDTTPLGRARGVLRAQGALVVGQVALSFVLLASAGLFLRSLTNTLAINPGFDTGHSVIVPVDLGFGQYDAATGRPFMRRMLREVEAQPGVASASLALDLPLGQMHMRGYFETEGLARGVSLRSDAVAPRYFETLDIPIVSGRPIDGRDREGAARAAVVNETLARRFWPGRDPIGQTFQASGATWTVVGVAHDGRYDRLDETPQPFFWLSLFQAPWLSRVNLLVRASSGADAMLPRIVRVVQGLDADLPVQHAMTTHAFFQHAVGTTAGPGRVLAALGLLALVLAAVGTYGLASYLAGRRRQEFGVRLALGADAGRLSRLVLAGGLRLGAAGAALGLLLSALAARLIGSLLFEVAPLDPAVLGAVAAIMVATTAAACYVPARSAGRTDPAAALRTE